MQISRTEDALVLAGLDLFLAELLRQIPASADPADNAAARERLLSKPYSDDARLNEEWEEYVQPDLLQHFQDANETVKDDLACIESGDESDSDGYRLSIPRPHFERWLNSLNQARLALAARHEFSDKELERDLSMALDNARDLGLFQIHFYGLIQECIVRELS